MTVKEWYPKYNLIERLILCLKYYIDPYHKKMELDCYLYYKFDKLSKHQKYEILLDHEIVEYEKKLNKDELRSIFNNKKEFYKVFGKYMKRKILFLDECSFDEFYNFFSEVKIVAVKPFNMHGGIGFRKLYFDKYTADQLKQEFNTLRKLGFICEELIVNEASYREIYSKSLNTVRVNTLIEANQKPRIISIVNQFGSADSITDNDEEKGIWSAANIETGIISWAEKDDETAVYYNLHPDTGKKIIGFQNKRFDEVKSLALELALRVPDIRLVGWDIAVTDSGLELMEGNVTPELGVVQAMTGIGYRTLFEETILC